MFHDCATIASVWHVLPSGPKNTATWSHIISVIVRVACTVSPCVSSHFSTSDTLGNRCGSSAIYRRTKNIKKKKKKKEIITV